MQRGPVASGTTASANCAWCASTTSRCSTEHERRAAEALRGRDRERAEQATSISIQRHSFRVYLPENARSRNETSTVGS
jgi:hypothetical protein